MGRAIDADAMLARLEEWNTSDSTDKALYNFTLQRILEQPTVEPERKKGKWVPAKDGYEDHVECTGCFKAYDWISQAQYYDFCPSCGADMRENK